MSTFNGIDAAAEAHISEVSALTTAALQAIDDFMPTIEALTEQIAPYYAPNSLSYTPTAFDQTGVTVPAFDELGKVDDALQEVNAKTIDDLSAGSIGLHPELRARIDAVNAEFETIWNDLQAEFQDTAPVVAFKEDDFVAEIIESLQGKLEDALSDTEGNSSASEARYYANDASRRNVARVKEITDTMDEFASRGWNHFSSAQNQDMQAHIIAKQNMDEEDRRRAVIMQQATLSMDNKWKAIDAGLRYDQILISFFDRKMQRAFQLAQSTFKVVQDLAELKFFLVYDRVGMQKEYFDLVEDNQRLIYGEFDQNVKAFEARMDALIAQGGEYANTYVEEGQVYNLRQKAKSEEREFNLSEVEIGLDVLRWNMAKALKAFADNLHAFEATVKMRIDAAAVGSSIQAGIAAAARNSVTTIIGRLSNDKVTKSA